jgi:hypothetical protein
LVLMRWVDAGGDQARGEHSCSCRRVPLTGESLKAAPSTPRQRPARRRPQPRPPAPGRPAVRLVAWRLGMAPKRRTF